MSNMNNIYQHPQVECLRFGEVGILAVRPKVLQATLLTAVGVRVKTKSVGGWFGACKKELEGSGINCLGIYDRSFRFVI